MRIVGTFAFPLVAIGMDDYSDPVNMIDITNVAIQNGANSPTAEGLRLNYIAGGQTRGLRVNCYADGQGNNNGTALRVRQAAFVTFVGGGFGNAQRSVDFTDGTSLNCTFIGQTFENTNIGISHRSSNSGGHTFHSPQITEVTQFAVQSTGALASKTVILQSPNIAASTATITGSVSGVTLTVNSISGGSIGVGKTLTGSGIPSGTTITAEGTGTGGIGTYTISQSASAGVQQMRVAFSISDVDPVRYSGVVIRDRAGVSTPAFPSSGNTVVNTTGRLLSVMIWGGTVVYDIINGVHIGVTDANPRTYLVSPGGAIGANYSSAPTWLWMQAVV